MLILFLKSPSNPLAGALRSFERTVLGSLLFLSLRVRCDSVMHFPFTGLLTHFFGSYWCCILPINSELFQIALCRNT